MAHIDTLQFFEGYLISDFKTCDIPRDIDLNLYKLFRTYTTQHPDTGRRVLLNDN